MTGFMLGMLVGAVSAFFGAIVGICTSKDD